MSCPKKYKVVDGVEYKDPSVSIQFGEKSVYCKMNPNLHNKK